LKIASAFNLLTLLKYIFSDIRKKPRAYKIGIFTVTITVAFVVIIYNILYSAPVVFMKLAEDQVGETDIVFHALDTSKVSEGGDQFAYGTHSKRRLPSYQKWPFVNVTDLQRQTEGSSYYKGFSPRWFGLGNFVNPKDERTEAPGVVVVIDSAQEVKLGLGRHFSKTVIGHKEAIVTRSTLRYLGIKPNNGETIELLIDLAKYVKLKDVDSFSKSPLLMTLKDSHPNTHQHLVEAFEQISYSVPKGELEGTFKISMNFTVVEEYSHPQGKFPDSYGNVMVID
jgi:hypothetical protein